MRFKSYNYQAGRMHGVFLAGAVVIAIIIATLALAVAQDDKDTQDSQTTDDARSAALASEHSPTTGDPNAPVHIVEFLDPACEACAGFYPIVKQLMEETPGKIRLSVRHIPFHSGAEYAVMILEASREQGLYWETLEALLATQRQWTQNHTVVPQRIVPAIASVGLDIDRIRAEQNTVDVELRMQRDHEAAVSLMVRRTPQFFVNGTELKKSGPEQLAALIRDELAKAERAQ
jgi:protein-disulfide isomerase